MVTFLYHEGSWTRGIFRRPAGARAVRELRDALDSGEFNLPLTRDHVFVIAGVFKDFLRSIPSSLLCCELHEEWMDVLEEEEEEEEQVQDVKRMIRRLPRENALLLRYLLSMLHGVQANARENQMTPFNLSVCIAPSLLWPPGAPCSPEVEGEGTKKVCELVKFMIEHCQQILGEDPSSLFGGPPQRLNTDETGSDSWLDPLTDSSYDSLENELDNSSGGSPAVCCRRPRVLQGSLDSILTFSDYDQDSEAPRTQGLKLHPLGSRTEDRGLSSPQDPPTVDTSSPLDSLALEGRHRQRRCSEPAIAYAAKFRPCTSDGLSAEDEDEDEEESKKPRPTQTRRSSPSLSSTPNSPAATRSSLDSLDSLSDLTWASRRGPHPAKTPPPTSSPPITPALTSGGHPDPPKDSLNWGTIKTCRGLHPNSWLKKGRRLSLTQQDNLDKEDQDGPGGPAADQNLVPDRVKPKPSTRKEAAGVKSGPRQLRPDSPPSHHRSTGSLQVPKSPWFPSTRQPSSQTSESKPSSPSLFFRPSAAPLSLFRQSKSVEEPSGARLQRRRGSEPGRQLVERASTLTRARLPSDPGLKVPEAPDARFCLSPCASKAVRDYFSSHPRSLPHSGQQVALALVQSRREWLQRCSDPGSDPDPDLDLDQLLFAEESYV